MTCAQVIRVAGPSDYANRGWRSVKVNCAAARFGGVVKHCFLRSHDVFIGGAATLMDLGSSGALQPLEPALILPEVKDPSSWRDGRLEFTNPARRYALVFRVNVLLWLPWALPGVLISLALLWAVLGSGDGVKLIDGTVSLLIIAITIKEMPLGTQMLKTAVQQISPELEEASNTAGAGWSEYFRRILLPLLKPTLLSVAIVVFISAARDISTVIFLSTHETRTLSLLMLDYIAEANQEKAAVLGVLLVLLIFALLSVGRLFGFGRRSA